MLNFVAHNERIFPRERSFDVPSRFNSLTTKQFLPAMYENRENLATVAVSLLSPAAFTLSLSLCITQHASANNSQNSVWGHRQLRKRGRESMVHKCLFFHFLQLFYRDLYSHLNKQLFLLLQFIIII